MDPTERWKPIAPATDKSVQRGPAPDLKKQRHTIPVACIRCRAGKAKCDGIRPQCVRCKKDDFPCQYDVAEGVSRAERMKLIRRDGLSRRLEEMERIVNVLRSGYENQSFEYLSKIETW